MIAAARPTSDPQAAADRLWEALRDRYAIGERAWTRPVARPHLRLVPKEAQCPPDP